MTRTIYYKRKRQTRTDYKKRLTHLLSGKVRFVFRKSLKNIIAQAIRYESDGDKVIVSVSSKELEKNGWKGSKNNLPAAYLVGLMLGKKAKDKKIEEGILDIGLKTSTKGGKVYAFLKGLVDAGIVVPHSEEILPSEQSISGEQIASYATVLKKEDKAKYDSQFSKYLKDKVEPEKLKDLFEEIKKKII